MFHFKWIDNTFIGTLFEHSFSGTIFWLGFFFNTHSPIITIICYFTHKKKCLKIDHITRGDLVLVDNTSSCKLFFKSKEEIENLKNSMYEMWALWIRSIVLLLFSVCFYCAVIEVYTMCMTKWFCQSRWSLETVWQSWTTLWSSRSIYNNIYGMHTTRTTSLNHSNVVLICE